MTDRPRVAAVVLGWNLKDDTHECIASLLASDYRPLTIIYVDNGSTDGASDYLNGAFPNLDIVQLEANVGIAGGYNAGIERALGLGVPLVFVVNNDTTVGPDMLRRLVDAADRVPDAGVFMPAVCLYGDRARLWSAGARKRRLPPGIVFRGLGRLAGPPFDVECDVEFAPSCGLLLRREVFERIGAFDTGYFMYYDDWDFCERVRRGGFKIRYVPDATMWHKVSLTTANSPRPHRWWYVMGRSSVRFYLRYYVPGPFFLAVHSAWFSVREVAKGNAGYLPLFWRGVVDGLTGRPMPT